MSQNNPEVNLVSNSNEGDPISNSVHPFKEKNVMSTTIAHGKSIDNNLDIDTITKKDAMKIKSSKD